MGGKANAPKKKNGDQIMKFTKRQKKSIHLHAILILVYVIVPQYFNLQNNKVYSILTKDCHTWEEKWRK